MDFPTPFIKPFYLLRMWLFCRFGFQIPNKTISFKFYLFKFTIKRVIFIPCGLILSKDSGMHPLPFIPSFLDGGGRGGGTGDGGANDTKILYISA